MGQRQEGIRTPLRKRGDNSNQRSLWIPFSKPWKVRTFQAARSRCYRHNRISCELELKTIYVSIGRYRQRRKKKFQRRYRTPFHTPEQKPFCHDPESFSHDGKKHLCNIELPADEVGNHLMDIDKMDEQGIKPFSDMLTEKIPQDLEDFVSPPLQRYRLSSPVQRDESRRKDPHLSRKRSQSCFEVSKEVQSC